MAPIRNFEIKKIELKAVNEVDLFVVFAMFVVYDDIQREAFLNDEFSPWVDSNGLLFGYVVVVAVVDDSNSPSSSTEKLHPP